MRSRYEIADILNRNIYRLSDCCSNSWQERTLHALRKCRTSALGGHIDQCDSCGNLALSYNSCRNRHCPKCQGEQREAWIWAREQELLPVTYFHVVFTLPQEINALCLYDPAKVYSLLFKTAWSVMCSFANDEKYLGARAGMIAILHTWGQNLSLHPHLHCIVPGGGVTDAGYWKQTRSQGEFLFPVKAMSRVFRARFVAALRKTFSKQPKTFFNSLFKKNWVIYAKRPFQRPETIVEYLGRYTHKIAISNHRIKSIEQRTVTFRYKDYRKGCRNMEMTLSDTEFIRRFSQHILPKGFVRIRHYGYLSSAWKKERLPRLQEQFGITERNELSPSITAPIHRQCRSCRKGQLKTVCVFTERGPPHRWLKKLEGQQILNP